jgi:bacillithiol biosynthesis cysteine-adding enzyme BshC
MTPLDITQLPFFSSLVKDYLTESEKTNQLYTFAPSTDGLLKSLVSKEKNYTQRNLLIDVIDKNYTSTNKLSQQEIDNLNLLKENGLAVTTAHQPNLFLGPLYTLTKAISTISISNQINEALGEKKIVPIFVIGSEDHDKEEILHTYLFGKKYEWVTSQKGPIGSMVIDESFLCVLNEWLNAFGTMPYAGELKDLYSSSYILNRTIAEGFTSLLRNLLGSYGLIVLDLNMREVKEAMVPIFEKELKEKFSANTLKSNLDFIRKNYSVQAEPREINLFEYKDGERIRIDEVDEKLIAKLKSSPESFSPNVILRPLMQQTVLPSIANIGGGAEVSYWLQLKPIFKAANIDFPVIVLRDIISVLDIKSWEKWTYSGYTTLDLFLPIDELKKKIALKDSNLEAEFSKTENELTMSFSGLESILTSIDKSLQGSYESELVKLKKSMELLYGKAIKAEKRKHEESIAALEKIKSKVFEDNYLIERKENFSAYYLKGGKDWIEAMIASSSPLNTEWKLNLI